MIISLVRLPADGLSFRHQYVSGELDIKDREFSFVEPPLVAGRVDRVGMEMRLRGEIKTNLLAPCDRCLSDVPLQIGLPFDLLYAPAEASGQATGEIELHERDLDFAFYANDQIDLDELVLEQLELGLPSRVLCQENCRGICSECGADLNAGECRCQKPVDPRWQALADLKAKLDTQEND